MALKQNITILADLGWHIDDTAGRHQICAEPCAWIHGKICGVDWTAWVSTISWKVYLHATPAIDLEFSEFLDVVRNGWPEKKVVPAARGFDFGDDE